jgi:hypothetical protein
MVVVGAIDIDDELVIVFDGAIDIECKDDCVLIIVELTTSDIEIIGVSVLLFDRIGLDETVLV